MKLNSINTYNQSIKAKNNPNFGLQIKKDKEFYDLIEILKNDWEFDDVKMSNLINEIENMAFNKDSKTSTAITFSPMYMRPVKRVHHIDEGIFFDTYEGTSRQRATAVDYHFYDPKKTLEDPLDFDKTVILYGASPKEFLSEIASDYAKYAYKK